ncbi:hypothetical protein RhiirA4_480175 [Rhizophagus irregularis]|uniref:Uncharacterized protein n=1 Tax=Rhizophagus irregularis TaxID=588596 RepID=A0A2I1HHI7_9GLOM|nr:hypothetical protein RhiirA4_480175 [Rhizophagus irregularis]
MSILSEWKLTDKVYTITIDNSSNIVKSAQLISGLIRIPCISIGNRKKSFTSRVISSSDPSKEVEILQVLKDSITISSGIFSQECLTHPQTSDSLARQRFLNAVTPAPPPAIQRCHSLRRLSLNGL